MPPLKKGWLMAARIEPRAMPRPRNGCASRHGKRAWERETRIECRQLSAVLAANETNDGSSDEA